MSNTPVIKKYKNSYRPYFYGDYSIRGKRVVVKLCKIKGTPPASLKSTDLGDVAFEKSKTLATEMLRQHIDEARGKVDAATLTRKAVALQTGSDKMQVKISDLKELNRNRRRIKQPSEHSKKFQDRVFDEFTKFADTKGKTYLFELDQDFADLYFKYLQNDLKFSLSSISKRVFAMSGAFKRFAPGGLSNPFSEICESLKEGKKIYPSTPHTPFTNPQVCQILSYTKNRDPELYNLFVIAAQTGMRMGDICTLRWTDVHFDKGFIIRKTNKTGAEITPCMTQEITTILQSLAMTKRRNEKYVFPDIAESYLRDSTIMDNRGNRMIAKALFEEEPEDAPVAIQKPPSLMKVTDIINASNFIEKKKARIIDTYERYLLGQSYREIERQTKRSRGQISEDIAEVEKLTKIRFRPLPKKQTLRSILEKARDSGTSGKNKRSKYGWHSFRCYYVVWGLLNNQPLYLISRNVGHSTVNMTLHYFQPTVDHIAELIATKPASTLDWSSWQKGTATLPFLPSLPESKP